MLGVVSIKLKRLSCRTMNGNYIGLLHAWLFLRYDWVSFHANLIGLRSLLYAWEESFGGQVRRVVGVSENEWMGFIIGSLSIKDFSLLLDRRLVVFLFYEELIQWEKKNLHTLWTATDAMIKETPTACRARSVCVASSVYQRIEHFWHSPLMIHKIHISHNERTAQQTLDFGFLLPSSHSGEQRIN